MRPVVVCGGGPVGLVLAWELAGWQVPVLLVDRHREPSPFPRGRAISTRSMEILRQLGVEDELTEVGLSRAQTGYFFSGESLSAREFGRVGVDPASEGAGVSPTAALACPQDRLEALLRRWIAAHPLIDARFGVELVDACERGDHVEVRLSEASVRTAWLVGADGSRSWVRRLAGIGTDLMGGSCANVNILIEADLAPLIRDRVSLVYTISNAEVDAAVLTVDNRRRWLVNVVLPEGQEMATTPQWCERMVRAAIGEVDVAFRVLGWRCWEATAWLARRYWRGRLLIVGDAAHVCTPYGGFGMNLGLADAHNLAWKLALCVTGRAGPELVETYEQERRPMGELTVAESARRLAAAREDHRSGRTRRGETTGRPSDGLVLGGVYRSAAVHAAGEAPTPEVARYQPDAGPGCRAPHVWLPDGRSVLDLFGPWFTLLVGPRYQARAVPGDLVHTHRLDSDLDEAEAVRGAYRIGDRGAVLVRPDGHVAWRAAREDEPPPPVP